MCLQSNFKNPLYLPERKNTFELKLLDGRGRVVKREKASNTVAWLSKGNAIATHVSSALNFDTSVGIYINAQGFYNTSGGIHPTCFAANPFYEYRTLALTANVADSLDAGNFYSKLFRTSNLATNATRISTIGNAVVGFNTGYTQTQTGAKGGTYQPGASSINGLGSILQAWNFATTQANGTINGIGLFPGSVYGVIASGADIGMPIYQYSPNVSQLGAQYMRYIGYKISGGVKYLYFWKVAATGASNVVVLNGSTLTYSSVLTLPNPADFSSYTPAQPAAVYTGATIGGNVGNFITVTVVSGTNTITYKICPEGTLTYGGASNLPSFSPPGSGSITLQKITADGQYIYFLCTNTTNTFIVKADTQNSMACTVIDLGTFIGRNNVDIFNFCPWSNQLFISDVANATNINVGVVLTTTASSSDIVYTSNIYSGSVSGTGRLNDCFFQFIDGSSNNHFIYRKYTTGTTYLQIDGNQMGIEAFNQIYNYGNVVTYAALGSPIIKTSSNGLAVSYTMSIY